MWHLFEAAQQHGDVQLSGCLRAIELPKWFRAAGLIDIWRKTTLVERCAPLRPIEREFMDAVLKFWANLAETLDLPTQELALWRALRGVDSPDHICNQPDFYWREGYVLVVGRVS
jgi:hypothetical protein